MSFDLPCGKLSLAGMSGFDPPSAPQRRLHYIFAGLLAALISSALAFAESERIFVATKVNGISMRFFFDTGAGVETSMWRDVSDILAIKSTRPDASMKVGPGQIRAGVSEPLTLELMGSAFPESRMAVLDGPAFAKWQIQGIIGWPSVRSNIWLIDLLRGQMGLLPELPDVSSWLKYPIVQGASTLLIQVPSDAGDKPGIVSIDTGSPDGVGLAPALWEKWRAAHPTEPLTYEGNFMLATGYHALAVTAAHEWSIDRLVMKDILLAQANPTDLAAQGPDYVATFGLGALRKFTVIIDGKNGYVYFRPHERATPLGEYNRLGAVFLPIDPTATKWAAKVLPGSPAADAGLRDGDILAAINHLDARHWQQRPGTWPPLSNLPAAGMPIEIEVTRDGRRVVTQAVPQDILRPQSAPVPTQPRPPELPAFHFLPPFAAVVRKADALKLPVRNPALSADASAAVHKDDKVTALVTVVDDDRIQQWLVLFVNTELKASERKAGKPVHVFTSSGHDLTFERIPTGVAVRALGPFEQAGDSSAVSDKWSGAILDGRSLTLGFDSVGATLMKVASARDSQFGFRSAPFSPNEAIEERKRLETAGVSMDDERAFVGGTGALMEFFRIAANTPGVRDVLRQLLDLSWTDYLRNPNINLEFMMPVDEVSSDWWGLPPGMPCRTLTFRIFINGAPKIVCRVAATRPIRPLQTVAGIVGIAAGRVDGSGPHVMVRLLGASPAEPN